VRRRAVHHGEWREDDYDVVADGIVVGRIVKAVAAPEGTPWQWTLAYGHQVVSAGFPPSHKAPRPAGRKARGATV
jgi:hypothetical protein